MHDEINIVIIKHEQLMINNEDMSFNIIYLNTTRKVNEISMIFCLPVAKLSIFYYERRTLIVINF